MTVTIGEPVCTLSPNARRVKGLLDQGMTEWQIVLRLHMPQELVREHIFEVRKEQMIMASKLTNEQRAEIHRLWKEEGESQADLAGKYGVSAATVCQIIKKMNGYAGRAPSAAGGEPEQIEQAAEPDEMTEEHTAAPPKAVITAVNDRIARCMTCHAAIWMKLRS